MSIRDGLTVLVVVASLIVIAWLCRADLDYHAPTATRHPTYTVDYGAGSPTHQP